MTIERNGSKPRHPARYSNPEIPEGINVDDEHPLKDFARMLIILVLIGAALVGVLLAISEQLVRFVPFELETRLLQSTPLLSLSQNTTPAANPSDTKIQAYLQALAQELATQQQLPKEMTIRIHYVDSDVVNAYATLGGNILIFRGLLELLENENTVAMVLAHEIAHIKHRDPIAAAGRGLTVGLALISIAGFTDSSLSQWIFERINFLTVLAFSRDQELAADNEALQTLAAYYGHIGGSELFFHAINNEALIETPEIFNTHPRTDQRLANIELFKARHGESGEALNKAIPLPKFVLNLQHKY